MFRTRIVTTFLALIIACSAATAADASADMVAEAMAAMANEPPLTQTDIDVFLKMVPLINDNLSDPTAIFQLYTDNNVSPQRFSIIGTKIAVGALVAQGTPKEEIAKDGQIPEFMMPNDDEIALVNKNLAAITELMEQ